MLKSIGLLIIVILLIDTGVITVSYLQQNNKLTEAGANMSALQSEVNTLNGELLTLRGSVALLQSRLADSESRASTLQTKLTTAEANVTRTTAEYSRAMQILMANMTAQQRAEIVNYDPGLGALVAAGDYGAGMGAP